MGKKLIVLAYIFLVAGLMVGIPSAPAAESVTVYSSNMQALNDLSAAEFEKTTGIKVNMVRAPSGSPLKG
jgi:ABC-type molybdate transport system substrate-binding protein